MRGFSTLEILIAMALLVMMMASVVLLSFGDQSLRTRNAITDNELEEAEGLLAWEQGNAQEDFRMLNATTSSDDREVKTVTVNDLPQDPYSSKIVTAAVSQSGVTSPQTVSLSELMTDYADPFTLDTCDTFLSGNWQRPQTFNYIVSSGQLLPLFPPAGHSFSSNNPISAIDAYHGMLYIALASTSVSDNDSLFTFDLSDPSHPSYRGGIDTNSGSTKGLSALIAAGEYVFGASSSGPNFKTCTQSASCAQLQIFDVSDPTDISVTANFLVPTSSAAFVTGSGGQASGNAIFYKDGYVYLGLQKTLTGPEFNIISVSDPAHPVWVGGYQVGNTINQIYVRGHDAYLVTDDKSREFIVLDISDPTDPVFVGSFDPKDTLGYETGRSMYVRGDDAFVGMTYASGSPEIYDLDISNPAAIVSKGTYTVGSTIAGLFARDTVLFDLASTIGKFGSIDSSDPTAMKLYAPPVPLAGTGGALDCEGNYFYIGSNAGQGNLTVITGS